MTLFHLLTEGTRALTHAGDPDASQDARALLMAAFHLDMVHFLLNRMQELPEDEYHQSAAKLYRDMIQRRRRRCPLQQILGSQEFMGFKFYVNQHVLIPRQDTETLVELVLNEQRDSSLVLLDLCTGSGCIALSLALKGGYDKIVATDISGEALNVAGKNASVLFGDSVFESGYCRHYKRRQTDSAKSPADMWLLQGDLFQALDACKEAESCPPARFDAIVSNPPYIPTAVISTLEPEVRDHEPMLALDGTGDGLQYYRRIAAEAKPYLKSGGSLYLEIGYDQGEAVSGLLEEQGYFDIRVFKDLPGNDRVVCARRFEPEIMITDNQEVPHV